MPVPPVIASCYTTGGRVFSPAVASGVVCVGSLDDNLYAFDLAGGVAAPARPSQSSLHPATARENRGRGSPVAWDRDRSAAGGITGRPLVWQPSDSGTTARDSASCSRADDTVGCRPGWLLRRARDGSARRARLLLNRRAGVC
jgi:hypothetical protein